MEQGKPPNCPPPAPIAGSLLLFCFHPGEGLPCSGLGPGASQPSVLLKFPSPPSLSKLFLGKFLGTWEPPSTTGEGTWTHAWPAAREGWCWGSHRALDEEPCCSQTNPAWPKPGRAPPSPSPLPTEQSGEDTAASSHGARCPQLSLAGGFYPVLAAHGAAAAQFVAQPRGKRALGSQKVTFTVSRDFKNRASLLAALRDLQGALGTGRWWQQRWHPGWHVLGQDRGSPPAVPRPAGSLCSPKASQREERIHCWVDASWGRRDGDVLPPLSSSRCTPAWGARDAFLGFLPSQTWRQSWARQGAGALQQQSGSLLWLLRPCAAFLLLPSHQYHVPPNAALVPQPCEPPWVFSDAPEPALNLGMRDHLSSSLFLG